MQVGLNEAARLSGKDHRDPAAVARRLRMTTWSATLVATFAILSLATGFLLGQAQLELAACQQELLLLDPIF